MAGIFGGAKPPPAPTPTPAPRMPDTLAPSVLEAKRKSELDVMSRAGRSSTILTTPSNRGSGPGGDSYASKTLGSGT